VSNFQPRQIVFAVADESVMATVTYKVGKEVHSWNKRKTNIVMDVVTKDNTDRLRVSGTRQIISEKFDTYLQNVFYFQEGLNIHTFEEALAQRGSRAPGEHYLPPAALPYDQMVLRPRQETVDDVACSVIELPGHEIQWIDPGCGYIARRIIRYQKSGTLSVEIENKEIFCDRLSGIWLPKRQIIRRYNTDSDPVELRGKLRAVETNTLIAFRRERLPESYFELTRITDGVLIDTTRNITEAIQHGRVVESKIGKR
jgi:hypothetical protein